MRKKDRSLIKLLLLILVSLLPAAGCTVPPLQGDIPGSTPAASRDIILATTTSTQDSGLLDVLLPVFEQESGYRVKPVAVGSGQALKMGETGNADLLLSHAPEAEQALMAGGYGEERRLVMHNDFVIVGPASDPAGIRGSRGAHALQTIAQSGELFISRGDDSGTHKMEQKLWQQAGIQPQGGWYLESGQGMGSTLRIASERGGYTISDRASFLSLRQGLDLEVLSEGDTALLNLYHVITISPEKWPGVNIEGARALARFLLSENGQAIIGQFGIEEYGEPLFTPDAGKSEEDFYQE
jgi:tungstate transport system substrate-binding protein